MGTNKFSGCPAFLFKLLGERRSLSVTRKRPAIPPGPGECTQGPLIDFLVGVLPRLERVLQIKASAFLMSFSVLSRL
jgi:hypothetical protein